MKQLVPDNHLQDKCWFDAELPSPVMMLVLIQHMFEILSLSKDLNLYSLEAI